MGRSQESFNKKDIQARKEKKRKDKEKKMLARRENAKSGKLDDMIAYVDQDGVITSTPPDPSKKDNTKLEDIEYNVPKRDRSKEIDEPNTGTVTFFNDEKGYGFIRDNDTKISIFVHANNLLQEIKEGNLVSYKIEKGHKGPAAAEVKLIK